MHFVPGKLDTAALKAQIMAGGMLTASMSGMAKVGSVEVIRSNGVIHVVDKVLLPG